jgi:hypothetical protein
MGERVFTGKFWKRWAKFFLMKKSTSRCRLASGFFTCWILGISVC